MQIEPQPPPHRGSPRPQAGPAGGPGSAAAVDPRLLPAGTLHVLDGPDRGRVWRLSPGTHLLGTSTRCDLPVTDPQVSRWHCMVAVTKHAPGRPCTVTVEDRGSNTGTVVDGMPAGRPSVLAPGSTIVVGRTTLGWAPWGGVRQRPGHPFAGQQRPAPQRRPSVLASGLPFLPRHRLSLRQRLRRSPRLRHLPFPWRTPSGCRRRPWPHPRRHRSPRPAARPSRRRNPPRSGGCDRRLPHVRHGSRRCSPP